MDNNRKNDPNHNRQGWGIILITTLLVTFMVMGFYSLMRGSGPEQISYDRFLEMVDAGEVQEVSLNSDRIYITLTDEARREEMAQNGLIGSAGTILERLQEQMEAAGYGFHHESEDGKYLIMANGSRAFAIPSGAAPEHTAPEKLTVLVVEPMKEPYVKEIDPGLHALQAEVGGDIAASYPFDELPPPIPLTIRWGWC